MKSDLFRNNRKALAALLLCSGFIVGHPLTVYARNSETANVETPQQQVKISGTVNDAMGPIIGASIVEKGNSRNGTITDMNGKFSLSVKPGAVLVISYIGYKTQEVTAVAGKPVNVLLKDNSEMLDEVVIVGFGTQKKVNLTGSVGVASAKELEARPVASATQALQGMVPGLDISTNTGALDQDMNISIRGVGTIGDGSSGSPLILIDGMEGDINTVNPQDIATVSVLKDAAASSIYGSRAPFGVVLITTKSGKEGKATVNYNNSFRFSSPINLAHTMDSYNFALYYNQARLNSSKSVRFNDAALQSMLDYQAGTGEGWKASSSNPDAWDGTSYFNNDFLHEIYNDNVFSQEHNVSVTGGSKNITYYTSFNYLDQGGLLNFGDDGIHRFNATAKVSAKVTKWLKLSLSTRFTRNDVFRPTYFDHGNTFYIQLIQTARPYQALYDTNGNLYYSPALQLRDGGETNKRTDRFYYQASAIIEPIKNWVTNVELNYNIQHQNNKESRLTAYQYGPTGVATAVNSASGKNEYLKEEYLQNNYLNLNIHSTYSHTFNDSHHMKIMGGFQTENTKRHDFNAKKYGFQDPDRTEFDLTTGKNSKDADIGSEVKGYSWDWATAGFFGRLNYDYKSRYLVEGNLRYDGTSRFRRGNRWQLSPSFSAGWNIAEEPFFGNLKKTIDQLKLRTSYGVLGNQNTSGWYPTYRSMSIGVLNGQWLNGGTAPNTSSIGSLVSSALTWEKVKTWNVGIDYAFFNNRLTGYFDYFVRRTEDMVGPAPELPATLGVSSPKTNNCDLKTRGWELQISWRDRLRCGFNYGVTLSLSDQQTYIDSYPGNMTGSFYSSNTYYPWQYVSGYKINTIWGYETIGIAKSQEEMNAHLASLPNGGQSAIGDNWSAGDIMYKDLNGDGQISPGAMTTSDHGDLKILGDSNPHFFFSLDMNASWKDFDIRAYWQGVLKHDFWPAGNSIMNHSTSWGPGQMFWGVPGNQGESWIIGYTQHQDYFRAEESGLDEHKLSANLDSYYPRPLFNNEKGYKNQYIQSRYMQNAAYVRLKNLQLGYTLPKAWTENAGISKCRIFVSAENVFTITSLSKLFDPETCSGGVGGNAYPLSRTWSCGLNVTF